MGGAEGPGSREDVSAPRPRGGQPTARPLLPRTRLRRARATGARRLGTGHAGREGAHAKTPGGRGPPGFSVSVRPRSGAHDLAGADARGARVDPATVAGGDERPHGLDVRVPTARRAAVRVRHRHTETGPLATHIAHGSHG